jgi:arylsulfatase A-like enzyme
LIIKAPGFKKLASEALVETIDLFPTLCDLAGLDIPAHLHGQSLVPVMKAPQTNGREVIYSRFHDGESIKTDRYLYTEWRNEEGATYARMLYDHRNDPGENVNIADEKSNKEIVEDLSALLHIEIEKAKKVQLVQ